MRKLKQTATALATISLVASQALASEARGEPPQTPPATSLSQSDINFLFEKSEKPVELVALSQQEMQDTEGAIWNFAIGAAGGLGFYAWHHRNNFSSMTWQGAAFSAGTGALTGGLGGALIRASGGGLVGNIAWRPNIMASNFGFSQYRNYNGW